MNRARAPLRHEPADAARGIDMRTGDTNMQKPPTSVSQALVAGPVSKNAIAAPGDTPLWMSTAISGVAPEADT